MKLLMLHVREFWLKSHQRNLESEPELEVEATTEPGGAVLAWVHVEPQDLEDRAATVRKTLKNLKWHARKVEVEQVDVEKIEVEEVLPQQQPAVQEPLEQAPAQPRVLISEVVIEGIAGHPEQERLELAAYDAMTVRPGSRVTRDQLKTDLDAIYATGWFSDVRIEPINGPLGVQLLVKVVPNPVLTQVELEPDDTKMPPEVVEQTFSSDYGRTLNLNELQLRMKELQGWYAKEGYSLARVSGPSRVSPEGVVQLKVVIGTVAGVEVQLASSPTQAGYDLEFQSSSGELFGVAQVKATETPQAILDHYQQYPHIPVITTQENVEALGDHPILATQQPGISNAELGEELAALENVTGAIEAVPLGASAVLLWHLGTGEGSFRDRLQTGATVLGRNTPAVLMGGLAGMITGGTLWIVLPVVFGSRWLTGEGQKYRLSVWESMKQRWTQRSQELRIYPQK